MTLEERVARIEEYLELPNESSDDALIIEAGLILQDAEGDEYTVCRTSIDGYMLIHRRDHNRYSDAEIKIGTTLGEVRKRWPEAEFEIVQPD